MLPAIGFGLCATGYVLLLAHALIEVGKQLYS
jgi:hypothetical protein